MLVLHSLLKVFLIKIMVIISKVYTRRRKRTSNVSKIPELPMDIVVDIMSRLPVKSVLRFKSVSKAWYNMIKDQSFIKKHRAYANLNPNPVFGAILSITSGEKCIFRVNLMEALDKPIDLELPFMFDYTSFRLLGICNGLVCVELYVSNPIDLDKWSRVCICNPLTEEFRLVPGIGEGCPFFEFSGDEVFTMYFGLCLNGDKGYELFKLFYEYFPDDGDLVFEGEAYSLTTNTWREIDVKRGDFRYLGDHKKLCHSYLTIPVFVHGVFYWGATDSSSVYIVSFDVEKEAFDEFLAPYDCTGEPWILSDLKGEAAVVVYHDDCESFDIWLLDEKNKSWVLKMKVEDHGFGNQVTVLGCMESGELVVWDTSIYDDAVSTLCLYNTNTGDINDLPYVNAENRCEVFLYTESLVPINGVDNVA